MAIVGAITAIAALTTAAITAAGAAKRAKKSKFDKEQEARKAELDKRAKANQLGLSAQEQRVREAQLFDPVRQAAAATRSRTEQLQSAAGQVSGGQLSQLRTEQTRALAEGGRTARVAVEEADIQRQREQQAERAQLGASIEGRRQERQAAAFTGAAQTAGALGQAAGAVPGTFQAAGAFGQPISSPQRLDQSLQDAGVSPEAQQIIRTIPARQLQPTLRATVEGDESSPFFNPELRRILLQSSIQQQQLGPETISALPPVSPAEQARIDAELARLAEEQGFVPR